MQLFMGGGKNFFQPYFFSTSQTRTQAKRAQCERLFAKLGVQGGGGSPLVSLLVGGLGAKPPAGFEGARSLAGSAAEPQEKF